MMMLRSARLHRIALTWVAAGLMVFPALRAQAAVEGCPAIDRPDAPSATISNGLVSAVVLLPDATNGYYRGGRFDWSGVVWCLTYKGHDYFGEWFGKDSKIKDPITGPVEDFRSADGRSATGYAEAEPGGLFVKPGIGTLRRIDEKPYAFNTQYPLVDGGKWTVKTDKSQVTFRQELNTQIGIGYEYEKKLVLASGEPVLTIEHALKNTGKDPLDIQVYNHDFFVFDDGNTGPGMRLTFPFTPQPSRPIENGAHLDGKQIVFDREISGQGPSSDLSGFSDQASDFDFVVENTETGMGVEEKGDVPLSKLVFWSNAKTACPEAYVHIKIAPGETGHWSIRYRFFAK